VTPEEKRERQDILNTCLAALECEDEAAYFSSLKPLCEDLSYCEHRPILKEIGRLTKHVHSAIVNFEIDERLAQLSTDDVPESREKLDYVLSLTEKAAQETMDKVDHSKRLLRDFSKKIDGFSSVEATSDILSTCTAMVTELDKELSAIMMSQMYQDLSGQAIKRVIALITEVETSLIELIRLARDQFVTQDEEREAKALQEGSGPQTSQQANSASGQSDVDDLLAELGL